MRHFTGNHSSIGMRERPKLRVSALHLTAENLQNFQLPLLLNDTLSLPRAIGSKRLTARFAVLPVTPLLKRIRSLLLSCPAEGLTLQVVGWHRPHELHAVLCRCLQPVLIHQSWMEKDTFRTNEKVC